MNCFNPARTIAWSSAMRIRIMVAPVRWLDGLDGGGRRLILGEPVVERLQADSEHLGAAPLVAFTEVERRMYCLAFDLRERRAYRHAQALADRSGPVGSQEVDIDQLVRHD